MYVRINVYVFMYKLTYTPKHVGHKILVPARDTVQQQIDQPLREQCRKSLKPSSRQTDGLLTTVKISS